MRALVVVLAVLGFVVGGIPLLGVLIDVMTSSDDTEILYQGGYAPLTNVQMSQDYEASLNLYFDSQSNPTRNWFLLASFPFLGAGLGALTAALLGRRGWHLTRA
ncbi:hypothetical protein [Rhodococcus sp. OK302]|uniref:hypothetical protein n=1 Tax=Rhodococcus sp. OK302 TaxID=1882769 RepID=UPI000B941AD3|nr:hypothetical protein [Rhodococcus sp. OK302]OYD66572.1 hypothetical protein BDB13_0068 [Rhodococcus sp. OK302]